MRPANLTPQAVRDLRRHVRRSGKDFGAAAAERLAAALITKCEEIGHGLDHGHRRLDVEDRVPYRFLTISPLVIAYNPTTRQVIRILDGRQDFSRVFSSR